MIINNIEMNLMSQLTFLSLKHKQKLEGQLGNNKKSGA